MYRSCRSEEMTSNALPECKTFPLMSKKRRATAGPARGEGRQPDNLFIKVISQEMEIKELQLSTYFYILKSRTGSERGEKRMQRPSITLSVGWDARANVQEMQKDIPISMIIRVILKTYGMKEKELHHYVRHDKEGMAVREYLRKKLAFMLKD
jgi:hypothetical protein